MQRYDYFMQSKKKNDIFVKKKKLYDFCYGLSNFTNRYIRTFCFNCMVRSKMVYR